MRVDLDYESVIAEAVERAGTGDFGDRGLEAPLRRLLAALDDEAKLHESGRLLQRERIVQILVTNLRFEGYWRAHPEIAAEEIRDPVVIVGLGRTGTTLLQRLLAADPRFFSLRWWEGRFPVPFPGEELDAPDERIRTAREEVAGMYATVPNLAAIHPLDAMAADEEILLLEQSFYSSTPESFADLRGFAAWLDARDQTPGYLHMKRLLQFVQWQKKRRGETGERWILKTPHHIHCIDVLLRVFPDARIVQTHRDPVEVLPSWASLSYSLWQQNSDVADPVACGAHWSEKFARSMRACMEIRDAGHEDRFLDVDFRDTARDPLAVVDRIYDFLGGESTEEARAAQTAWLAENRRDLRPPHDYTLETFGYTEAGLADAYREYRERFILGRDGAAASSGGRDAPGHV